MSQRSSSSYRYSSSSRQYTYNKDFHKAALTSDTGILDIAQGAHINLEQIPMQATPQKANNFNE